MTGSIDVGAADLGREAQGVGFDGPAPASSDVTGLMSAADKAKLDAIEAGATGDMTPAELLTAIKTVDGAGSGLDADLLDGLSSAYFLPTSSYTAADVLAKIKTVDGAGSGLDADLLDGLNSSQFLRSDVVNAAFSTTGTLTIQGSAPMLYLQDTDAGQYDFWVHANSNTFYILADRNNDGAWDGSYPMNLDAANNIGYVFGSRIATWGYNSFSARQDFIGNGTGNSGMATATGSLGEIMVQGNGVGAAMATFHRPGAFAAYIGIDTDNKWKVGGWSMGAAAYELIHTGNAKLQKVYESAPQAITSGGALTLGHGLGVKPPLYVLVLQCVTAQGGYAVGDETSWRPNGNNDGSGTASGYIIVPDATNMFVRFGSNSPCIDAMPRKDTGADFSPTNAAWNVVIRAWA